MVDIDAFQTGSVMTQELLTADSIRLMGGSRSAAASGGSYRRASTPQTVAKDTFTGTGVDWVTATGPAGRMDRVGIDGTLIATVDLYSSAARSRVVEPYGGLAPGTHTLVVTVVPSRDPLSTGNAVVIDVVRDPRVDQPRPHKGGTPVLCSAPH